MRVAIDATALGSEQGGDDSMVRGLLEGLAAVVDQTTELTIIARSATDLPATVATHPSFSVRRVTRRRGLAHYALGLPHALKRLDPAPDLVCAINHGPLRAPAPVALFVQDLSFHHHPEHYPRTTRARLRAIVPRQAAAARSVLTISEFSRRDLIDSYGLDPAKVLVVPDAVVAPPPFPREEAADGRAWLRGHGVGERFVLCLGNLHPRKNVARLIEASTSMGIARPELRDVRLVVAGARWWGRDEEDRAAAKAPPGSVVFLGPVDERRKEQLLHLAEALAYVSLFEGFGLPPLEAMARGTAVVASDTTAVAETSGDGALLVDPLDTGSITDGLVRVLEDDDLRAALLARGRARAASYPIERTGRAALAAFTRTLELDGPRVEPPGAAVASCAEPR